LGLLFISCRNSKRKRAGQQGGTAAGKKGHETKDKKGEKSSEKLTPGRATAGTLQPQNIEPRGGAPSVVSERSDSSEVIDDKKKIGTYKGGKHPRLSSAIPALQVEEPKPPSEEEEREKEMAKK